MGNGPGADGTWMWFLHPTQTYYAFAQYKQMGEIAYVTERKRQAVEWIREDLARFAGVSLKKFVYFWAGVPRTSIFPPPEVKNALFLASSILTFLGLGLVLWQKKPAAWLFFWLVLLYPLVYYFVFPHARYRHPIEPEIGILIVYVIAQAERGKARQAEG